VDYKNRLIAFPQNRVWRSYPGGRILDELAGLDNPRDSHFPEDWIGSVTHARNPGLQTGHKGISAACINGREMPFTDLIALDPAYFLGDRHVARFGPQPMVLVKLLDSAVRLQLQAHPTAEFARAHLDSNSGKAEAYYILSVRDDFDQAFVYLGFQRPPSRAELKRCVLEQDIEAMEGFFDRIAVQPGDMLFIPGGLPHAIGGGLFMVEIMEPSDLVVRFEFERNGYTLPESERYMNRGLDFCLDFVDFGARSESTVRREHMFKPRTEEAYGNGSHRQALIGTGTTPCFQVKKSVINGVVTREESSFYIGVVTQGACTLQTGTETIELARYDKFFCPAGLGAYTIESQQGVQILECFPPVSEN
jgi:mannose-6-phosphate isomerase